MKKESVTRRELLRVGGLGGMLLLAAACAPKVVEKVVEKEVTKIVKEVVKETVMVAGTPQVVEKEVTKIVKEVVKEEVEKVVTATPVPALEGELQIWVFPLTANDKEWLWEPLMERFHQEYPDIETNIELLPWGGRREKMLTAFAAGSPSDLAYVNTDTMSLFGRKKVLVPLDDIVSQEAWDDLPEQSSFGLAWKGEHLMYPTLLILSGNIANKTLLEEVGGDPENPPIAWDDYRELGPKCVEKGYFLYAYSTLAISSHIRLTWQAGGTWYNEEATKCLLDQQPGIDAFTFITDLYRNGWVPKEGAVGSSEEAAPGVDYFVQKQQVISHTGSHQFKQFRLQAPDIEYMVLPPKKYKKQVQWANTGCWGIFKGSKQEPAATAWLRWMIRPENQGFYCSVTGFITPRLSALKYWTADSWDREFADAHVPYIQMNQDCNNWFNLGAVISAPNLQAAALGEMSGEEAAIKTAAEMNAAIEEELAKEE